MRRLVAWAGCVVVALLVAWYAGGQFAPAQPRPPAGSVRLGPDPGEPVAGYLARLPALLPVPGTSAPALVQLAAEVPTADAALLAGVMRVDSVVLRVPLARVQTALYFEALDPRIELPRALDTARQRAAHAAAAEAGRLTGRPGAVAAAEQAALADPGCACVVAFVVEGERAALETLAGRPGVRAVHAAPAGTTPVELALAPLLPEQTDRADPLPDDGPVPTAR
ncbi:hypothetical protein ACFQE5_03875 [Pseudonocardia hispaniensis]|uniref:DUF4439 domain-containing protein n=1 Tax=Pseudonocardia hispaniensis TaxID=904933 RepID=A0ABW1IYH5_9PSEU